MLGLASVLAPQPLLRPILPSTACLTPVDVEIPAPEYTTVFLEHFRSLTRNSSFSFKTAFVSLNSDAVSQLGESLLRGGNVQPHMTVGGGGGSLYILP